MFITPADPWNLQVFSFLLKISVKLFGKSNYLFYLYIMLINFKTVIMEKKKVYVAGKLNDSAVGYIKNFHRMIKTAREVRSAGYAVYVPCNDFLEGLVDGNFDYAEYFDNSQPWLVSADAIFLTPGWETSSGTAKEIETAKSNNIPVFDTIRNMNLHFYGKRKKV
jgi:hypothetical protein